ncbi:MAG: DoxX family protein [Actinobacteria bacterium]|nr:DoxX family protein [Actinomycetota bacterium]
MKSTTDIDLILLILRATAGLTLAAHGWNKFFGGGRIPGTGRWFDSIGMRPGRLNAILAASSEVGAGVLLALGLLNPLAAAGVIGVMVVAFWTTHRSNGFFIIKEGYEYVFILSVMALVSATLGPGTWSLDEAFGIAADLDGWTGFWIALLLGVGGGVLQMLVFFRPSKVTSGD